MKYLWQRLRLGARALPALGWYLAVNTTPVAAHDGTPLTPHTAMNEQLNRLTLGDAAMPGIHETAVMVEA